MHLEGWLSRNYYILFSNQEKELFWGKHHLRLYLPHYSPLGLFNWEYFILVGTNKSYAIAPIIPLQEKYITSFAYKNRSLLLTHDSALKGKIKWYKTPLVFGGKADDPDNISYVNLEMHAELVERWNKKYFESVSQ